MSQPKKQVMMCFDFEGRFGMPSEDWAYDLIGTTNRLLAILDRHQVKAIFFIVGKIIEEEPELIKHIAARGHEIGLHGYRHENLAQLNEEELAVFETHLARAEARLTELIGKKPITFRSPYLMTPQFDSPRVYQMFERHDYQWVSNRELRQAEELFRPDRLKLRWLWGKNNWFTRLLTALLNIPLLKNDSLAFNQPSLGRALAWLHAGAAPFKRGPILEVPVYSPLDCDLLGLPKPTEDSPQDFIDYATACLQGGINRPGQFYNINCHDWLIGGGNRMQILDHTLEKLAADPRVRFVTAIED